MGTQRFIVVLKRDSHNHILIQSNPIHAIPWYFFHIHSDVNLHSSPRFFKWPLSFRFPHQNPTCISLLLHVCHRPCTTRPSLFYHLKIFSYVYKSCSSLLRLSPASHYLPLLGPNIFFGILFQTLLACVLPIMWETKFQRQNNSKHYAFPEVTGS